MGGVIISITATEVKWLWPLQRQNKDFKQQTLKHYQNPEKIRGFGVNCWNLRWGYPKQFPTVVPEPPYFFGVLVVLQSLFFEVCFVSLWGLESFTSVAVILIITPYATKWGYGMTVCELSQWVLHSQKCPLGAICTYRQIVFLLASLLQVLLLRNEQVIHLTAFELVCYVLWSSLLLQLSNLRVWIRDVM